MNIKLKLCGPHSSVRKTDIDRNIAALDRIIQGEALAMDFMLLMDTKSILEGIKNELPE